MLGGIIVLVGKYVRCMTVVLYSASGFLSLSWRTMLLEESILIITMMVIDTNYVNCNHVNRQIRC